MTLVPLFVINVVWMFIAECANLVLFKLIIVFVELERASAFC